MTQAENQSLNRRIRLSHSAINSLHTCERMFQLDRLLVTDSEKKDYPDIVFGKAFERGVCSYLIHQDQDKALFELFLAYTPLLESEKKDLELCLFLLLKAFPELDKLLMDWEVCTFNGKPALELSFQLLIDPTYYYVGYVDVVLKNRWTGRVAVMDNKTTGLQLYDLSPMYQNSDQCMGYSIVIDQIVGEENSQYDVLYFVGQIGKSPFTNSSVKLMTFAKTLQDRLHWFIRVGLDVEHLKAMRDLNVFPIRGSSCLQYMRPCKHFGTCTLHGLDEERPYEPDLIEYQFTYQLDEVISDHLRRLSE